MKPSSLKMTESYKCRVCLGDGAKHQIFENIESEDGIYSMIYLCFNEKVSCMRMVHY